MRCGEVDLSCTRCRLSRGRMNVVRGSGPCDAPVVFVGEAPGKDEDLDARPFVGRAGKVLDQTFQDLGVDRRMVYITNLVKCRPPSNRRPRRDEIDTCSMFLESELKKIRPLIVCALGQTAAQSLLGRKGSMAKLASRGERVRLAGMETRLFVAYHPAACLYQRRNLLEFKRQIRRCLVASGLLVRQR